LNFAAVVIRVMSIDWLHLSATVHRRALFERNNNVLVTGNWLAP
jgi:hypothetical protein